MSDDTTPAAPPSGDGDAAPDGGGIDLGSTQRVELAAEWLVRVAWSGGGSTDYTFPDQRHAWLVARRFTRLGHGVHYARRLCTSWEPWALPAPRRVPRAGDPGVDGEGPPS
jgi:hypothetical protein